MLIQNTNSMAQAPQPAQFTSDSAPSVAVGSHSNAQAQPSVSLELSHVAVKPAAEQQPSVEQLKSVVDKVNKMLKQSDRNIQFSLDTDTQKPIVKLMDSETGELIRQYPAKAMLAISHSIDKFLQGVLLKQKA